MMMADSSQMRIFGKVDGQFLHARLWLSPILDVQTVLHFGQTKVWAEVDWDAAHSFCLLHLSVVVTGQLKAQTHKNEHLCTVYPATAPAHLSSPL